MPWWVLRATDPRDLVMTENWRRCAALIAALTASLALSVPAQAASIALSVPAQAASIASEPPGALLPLPSLPVNACHNSSLPQDYGTNFPVPNDPNGFGFANQTVIGWQGNFYAPFAYLSGSYFARGVPTTYRQGGQSYCGAMYSFGVYDYGLAAGQAPAPGSVQWTMADGYLPAMTTSFTRDGVKISITDFADQQSIGGGPVELVYTRVSVTNEGPSAVTVPSGQSGPDLVQLDANPDAVAPGATVQHDFVAAVDNFGSSSALPTADTVAASAQPYDRAFGHMASYWNQRLSAIPTLALPNVGLPDTGGL